MFKQQNTQLFGIAAALGGALYLILVWLDWQRDSWDIAPFWRYGALVSLLFVVGVVALAQRSETNMAGKIGLTIAAVAALSMTVGMGLMAWFDVEIGWVLWSFGILGHMAGLALFAVADWRKHSLTQINGTALLMTLGFLIGMFLEAVEDSRTTTGGQESDYGFIAIIVGFCLGWVLLGLTLASAKRSLPATLLLLFLVGCGNTDPAVSFSEPQDGATVTAPVKVEMSAENFIIEPAAEGVHDGAGHLHIMIDVPCVAVGAVIPKDDQHRHFGDGSTSAELDLAPGRHTLCLQAADGAHVALDGLQQTIAVTVSE